MEIDRYAWEARNRALRYEGNTAAHTHYMGHASGLDHAAAVVRGALEKVKESTRGAA